MRLLLAITGLLMLIGCQNPRQTLPDACYEPPESGMCRAAFQRFYFDRESGSCRAFIWGGCKGNVPFETLEACTSTCKASAADSPPSLKQSQTEESQ